MTSTLEMRSARWRSGPLVVASTHQSRRRGLSPVAGQVGVVFRARSIHTFRMRHRLAVVALSRDGVVLSARHVSPCRVFTCWRSAVIVETTNADLPAGGEVVSVWKLTHQSGTST